MEREQLTELVMRARSGDHDALEDIFRVCSNQIYFLALKNVKNRDDALDIVQETFISVFKNINKLKSIEAFNAWLCSIAINKCRKYWRNRKEVLLSGDESHDYIEIAEAGDSFIPQSAIESAETRSMIMSLIDSLPDEQRMSVILYYYKRFKVEEIAEIMECPLNTVKSRLFYARKQIKEGVDMYEKKGDKIYATGTVPILTRLFEITARENTIRKKYLRITGKSVE